MLKELDDQAELLDQEIPKEKKAAALRAKRRREEALARKSSKKQHLVEESAFLKRQLDEFTLEIRQLQEVFATLEDENEDSPDDAQSAEVRRQREEECAQNEFVEIQQEIVLLKEVQKATIEKIDVRACWN